MQFMFEKTLIEKETSGNIIVLGPPLSGKSSFCQTILSIHPHIYFSVRKYFEPKRRLNTVQLPPVGFLLPDNMVWDAFLSTIDQATLQVPFLLDGFPGTINQAKLISNWVSMKNLSGKIFYLDVKKQVALNRMYARKVCYECDGGVDAVTPSDTDKCPFCGNPISKRIDDTKKNISWIKELYDKQDIKMKFLVKNVLDLSKVLKTESVQAIITEPYLGPQRGQLNLAIIIKELEYLYSGALKEFKEILKSGKRVVMVWPLFYGNKAINPNISGFKIKNFLPSNLIENEFIKKHCSSRQTIIYGRAGQKVFREIVVLEKE